VFHWSRTLLYAAEEMKYVTIARMIENLFKVGAGAMVLALGHGLTAVVLVVAASKVLSCLVCCFYAVRQVAVPVWRAKLEFVRYIIHQAPAFSLIAVFNSLFWSLSVIMLTRLQGEASAGVFSAAYKLVDMFLALSIAYGQALFPVASRISRDQPLFFRSLVRKSVKYISLLTTGLAGGLFIFAAKIIEVLYGPGMEAAVPVLQVLAWVLVPFAIVPVLAYALTSNMLHKRDLAANFYSCITVFFLNAVLVPSHGALGAAVALLASCVLFMAIEFYWVERQLFHVVIEC